MHRSYVHYADRVYTISDRRLVDVRREVETILESGRAGWLDVNYGEGRPTPTRLLVSPGVAIGLTEDPIADEV